MFNKRLLPTLQVSFVLCLAVLFLCVGFTQTSAETLRRQAIQLMASLSVDSAAPILFIPLDDRPVTMQLPAMLADIAGVPIRMPPVDLVGHYLTPGNPDALFSWIEDQAPFADGIIASSDMLLYGGLIASRLPSTPEGVAFARARRIATLHAVFPTVGIDIFGSIERLAPTGVPSLGPATSFYATGSQVDDLAAYANLPDPPRTAAASNQALRLRQKLGSRLQTYLRIRKRNRRLDAYLLAQVNAGIIQRLVLGQDDAGPIGLHLRDVAALRERTTHLDISSQAAIEPGTDELGMALLARKMLEQIKWRPRIAVVYAHAATAKMQDRIEFTPVDSSIGALLATCGLQRVEVADHPDLLLFVRGPDTTLQEEQAFLTEIAAAVQAGTPSGVVDLTFLRGSISEQRVLAQDLISARVAGNVAAFASWNTTANSVGTAVAGTIAVAIGKKQHRYNDVAHAQFMLDRYADDYAYRTLVRPALNSTLRHDSLPETYFLSGTDLRMQHAARQALWPQALALLATIYPQYRDAGLTISLPWQRSFETRLDVRLRAH